MICIAIVIQSSANSSRQENRELPCMEQHTFPQISPKSHHPPLYNINIDAGLLIISVIPSRRNCLKVGMTLSKMSKAKDKTPLVAREDKDQCVAKFFLPVIFLLLLLLLFVWMYTCRAYLLNSRMQASLNSSLHAPLVSHLYFQR